MSRLIAFGCSHTYGVGLSDCWDGDGVGDLPPSKFAWPQLLADMLDLECVNASNYGASNREIWWNIINFPLDKTDKIVVQWTYPNRDCIINSNGDIEQLTVWSDNDVVKKFVALTHDDYDKSIESHTYIQHANMLVSGMYNFTTDIRRISPFPHWQTVDIVYDMNPLYVKCNKAIDGGHGDSEFHKKLAQEYYNILCQE